jgi:esterase/lipase
MPDLIRHPESVGPRVKPGVTRGKLCALALLGTPLHLSPFVRRIVPVVRYTPVRWIYTTSPKDWKTSVADPDGLIAYQESSYARIPTKSVYQTYDLERAITLKLERIHIPTLLIHSRLDEVAPPSNVTELQRHLHNPAPEVMWLEKSYHVLTLDYERDAINQRIMEFFRRN